MKIDTLEKLYEDQMGSMREGERMLLDLYARLLTVVSHARLRDLLRGGIPRVRERISRLDEELKVKDAVHAQIVRQARSSPGLEGLLHEVHIFLERAGEQSIIDAGVVALLHRIAFYMVSCYETVLSYAKLLEHESGAAAIQRSLDGLKAAQTELGDLSTEVMNRTLFMV